MTIFTIFRNRKNLARIRTLFVLIWKWTEKFSLTKAQKPLRDLATYYDKAYN